MNLKPYKSKLKALLVVVATIATVAVLLAIGGCCFRLEVGECSVPPATATPTPALGATPTPRPTPTVLCWDSRLNSLGVRVLRRDGPLELIAAWTTLNGDWGTAPACAWVLTDGRNRDVLGGDHHVYGRAEDASGIMVINETFALVWPGGGDTRLPEPSGWVNLPLAGQNWDPATGPGPYDWFPFGGDKLTGIGLPYNHHVSFFGIWRIRSASSKFDVYIEDMKAMGRTSAITDGAGGE